MKILYLDQTGELGGAELSLIDEIASLPHDAEVVLFENGPLVARLETVGARVAVVAAGKSTKVRKSAGWQVALTSVPAILHLVQRIARHARRNDLIYANSQKAFVVGTFVAALTRRPLVWRLNDMLTEDHFSPLLRRVVVSLANWPARSVIVNSEASKAAFIEAGGDPRRVAVAYPGIDPSPFDAVSPEHVTALRTELGASDGRPLIGVFGRISPWKGQAVFVDAIARTPEAIGVIVGSALFGEHAYEAELKERVAAAGLGERVRFLGFRSDIPALMRAMDVIVHCSIAPEPFGRVVVEAMLATRPVVASAAGGVCEIVAPGETGLLHDPGDVTGLAKSLAALLADPEYAATLAQAGRKRAEKHFTVTAMAEQVAEILGAIHLRTRRMNSTREPR